MKLKLKVSLFWKLLLLCGGLIIFAAIAKHVLLSYMVSTHAMRKLYLQEWQLTSMQNNFQRNFKNGAMTNLNDAKPSFVINSFSDFVSDEGFLIEKDQRPYLRLWIDNLAMVNLNGDIIGQLGEKRFTHDNLFTELNLAAREDLVEALIGKDFFGTSRSEGYLGVRVSISLKDVNGVIVGALVVDQRRELSDNLTGLAFGFKQVMMGIADYVVSLLFACFFFALVMAFYLKRRLNRITEGVQQWQRGDFTGRIVDNAKDELSSCSLALNNMADSLQNALEQEAKLAATQERHHLAIELHDTVKQRLFATNLKVALCEKIMTKEPKKANKLLGEISHQCQSAFIELQHTIDALRLNDLKTWSQLHEFLMDWQARNTISIELTGLNNAQPQEQYIELFWRGINEALQNVVKHSQATQVRIDVSHIDHIFQVKVLDNGLGCGDKPILGQGLSLLSTSFNAVSGRVLLVACTANFDSQSAGSELLMQLPMPDSNLLK